MNANNVSVEQNDGPSTDTEPWVVSGTCPYPPPQDRRKDVTESGTVLSDAKDIEHAPVRDDPRYWSRVRKVRCYFSHEKNTNPVANRILF